MKHSIPANTPDSLTRTPLISGLLAAVACAALLGSGSASHAQPAAPAANPAHAASSNTVAGRPRLASTGPLTLSSQMDRFLRRMHLRAAPASNGSGPPGSDQPAILPPVHQLGIWQSIQQGEPEPAWTLPWLSFNEPATLPNGFWSAAGREGGHDEERDHAGAAGAVGSADMVNASELDEGRLRITVNDNRIIRTSRPFYRVSIASPEVADVTPLSPDTLLISTRAAGTTQMVLWDEHDQAQTLLVQSEADLREVQEKLDRLLENEQVEAIDLRGRIALRGRVSNTEVARQAIEIASAYGDVVDFLVITGNQQVMLEIRFAEVSRVATRQLGVNFAFADGTSVGASTLGGVNPIRPGTGQAGPAGNPSGSYNVPGDQIGAAVSVFGGGQIGETAFNFFISALRENNLLRVLAEPNLTVISGEQGEFLAGGEFPVPVPNLEGIGIEYREFGVKLRYLPIVLGDGRIRLRVEPEVSDLDFTAGVQVGGVRVPGLRKRSLSTTVELVEGQTFALAGLLDSNVVANKAVTPLLGDVPVLGALFRSTRYQRRETELVILVTPRLVSPLNPDQVPPLPGEAWRHPNEIELFLMGQLGGEAAVDRPHEPGAAGRAEGEDAGPRLEAAYTFLPPEPPAGR